MDEKQAKKRLKKAKKEYEDAEKLYEEVQITHRGKVEEETAENDGGMPENDSENSGEGNSENGGEGVVENGEISQSLKYFREKWEKEIDLPDDKKKAIIDAVNKIPHRATIESDGSRLVEFELGGKKYQCLDINLLKHSDSIYLTSTERSWYTNNEVISSGMIGGDTGKRRNCELAEYVEDEKNNRQMEIPTFKFYSFLMNELGKEVGLTELGDKIAMRMYLTGNYGEYYLAMENESMWILACSPYNRNYYLRKHYGGVNLCMIACK